MSTTNERPAPDRDQTPRAAEQAAPNLDLNKDTVRDLNAPGAGVVQGGAAINTKTCRYGPCCSVKISTCV
jgi:hypothetical protein